jgi:hypothetical protein
MEFKDTFSREFLQNEQTRFKELLRIQSVTQHVNQHSGMVVGAARDGKTQYTVEMSSSGVRCGNYVPTVDDLLEGYRLKFPDCRVEYGETWEPLPRNPNQMVKKSGIIIDWS